MTDLDPSLSDLEPVEVMGRGQEEGAAGENEVNIWEASCQKCEVTGTVTRRLHVQF